MSRLAPTHPPRRQHIGTPPRRAARILAAASIALLAGCAARTSTPRDGARPSSAAGVAQGASTPIGFSRTILLETTSETSANVSIGDLNGDGTPDLVLAKGRHWPLVDRVLLGDGRGAFPTSYDLGTPSDRSYSGLLVDLDGDGDLDVVISNDRPDPKRTYRNDGRGHFSEGSTFGRPEWSTRNASVADLNGDGLPDIVVTNRSGRAPTPSFICLNRGGGRFDADCLPFSTGSSTTITPADFNNDGLVDLAVPHRDGGQGYVYLHEPTPTEVRFRTVPFGPADATIREAEAGDLDGDGLLDLVTIDEKRGVALYFGTRGGGFGDGVPLDDGDASPYALALGDVDRDGRLDIVVGHVEAPSTVHRNDGSGRRYTRINVGDARGTVYGFAIGDLNGDGVPDIAAARSEAPNVLYLGDAGGARVP